MLSKFTHDYTHTHTHRHTQWSHTIINESRHAHVTQSSLDSCAYTHAWQGEQTGIKPQTYSRTLNTSILCIVAHTHQRVFLTPRRDKAASLKEWGGRTAWRPTWTCWASEQSCWLTEALKGFQQVRAKRTRETYWVSVREKCVWNQVRSDRVSERSVCAGDYLSMHRCLGRDLYFNMKSCVGGGEGTQPSSAWTVDDIFLGGDNLRNSQTPPHAAITIHHPTNMFSE